MKSKITNLMNKTWVKFIVVFLVIFSVIFVAGFMSINYLSETATDNHIHSENITVVDKTYDNNYYFIMGDNNQTYSILNNDKYGKKIFDSIEVGHEYKIIVRDPDLTDMNHFNHILQVHNVTD